jgi:hypothetical protein
MTTAFDLDAAETAAPATLPLALLLNPGLVQASLAAFGAQKQRRVCRPLDRRFKNFLSKDVAACDDEIDAAPDEVFTEIDLVEQDGALTLWGARL